MLSLNTMLLSNTIIADRINKSAKAYRNELVGRKFLILYEGQSVEVLFKAKNFLHLCGVDTQIKSATEFYRRAARGKIGPKDISFSDKHPFSLAERKTTVLMDLPNLLKREMLVATSINTMTHTFALGTTDLQAVLCFDSDTNKNLNTIKGIYVPHSIRVEYLPNSRFADLYSIDYILTKETNSDEYNGILYGDRTGLDEYITAHSLTMHKINIG